MEPTDCPYYLISRVTLLATSCLKKALAAQGAEVVKPAYLGVLMSLWKENGLKMVELGRRAGLEPSTMSGLLDRMGRDGLVSRSSDPKDRRTLQISLTEPGWQVRDKVLLAVEQAIGQVFKGISDTELTHTKDVLKRVVINMREDNLS